ncbi:phage capsid protein [Xenorhabdus vietnamensis]|uniref:Phage capsid protein n=1 Tax=Xenorhabdus vietnamensis TaxID=351656 RepID=A0A1Y2SAZ1_9GAMM|nr:GPO family capsid scaffolding protein [Xenorhabdus vietnamensis]OTA15366.1 phage capsid protein [Xenorhabdus vietnamensis]
MSELQLTTTWICVATEGQTVDKRVIEAQWLYEIAETYDTNYYTALIWEEHNRALDNLGEVLAARTDVIDGKARLYVRLRPNLKLMEYNRQGQKLFCSIEVEEDFQGKGIFYLFGLAVTDSPASVGTDRLKFSINRSHFSRKKSKLSISSPRVFNLSDGLKNTKNRWFTAISAG